MWLESDELEAVEGEDVAAAFPGGADQEALLGFGGVDADGGSVLDGGGDGAPEFVADAGGDGADLEAGLGLDEPATQGPADVVGDGGGRDHDHCCHGSPRFTMTSSLARSSMPLISASAPSIPGSTVAL